MIYHNEVPNSSCVVHAESVVVCETQETPTKADSDATVETAHIRDLAFSGSNSNHQLNHHPATRTRAVDP
jgi:hypothetical protein